MSEQISMFDSRTAEGHAGTPDHGSHATGTVDWYNLIARERGMPLFWRWFELRAVGPDAVVTGAVCRVLFKSGPRNGTENWAKRDRSTERQIVITRQQLVERKAQWERETWKCSQCFGSGNEPYGWSRSEGPLTRPCSRCTATGQAQ